MMWLNVDVIEVARLGVGQNRLHGDLSFCLFTFSIGARKTKKGAAQPGKKQSCKPRTPSRELKSIRFVGLQPTVIAPRASPPLLEQSSSTIQRIQRFKESWTRVARQYSLRMTV